MDNPWAELPKRAPFILLRDWPTIVKHNAKVQQEAWLIRDEVLPEPYLGRRDAPIVLLNLNPSFAAYDIPFYDRPDVQQMWQDNILHNRMEYPFYLLDPRLTEVKGGSTWWNKKLRILMEATSREAVARSLLCVEYFPYHARKYDQRIRVPSQAYSFHLVREAMARQATIIFMRSRRLWFKAVPDLASYPGVAMVRNPQNPMISPGNLPDDYDSVLDRVLAAE